MVVEAAPLTKGVFGGHIWCYRQKGDQDVHSISPISFGQNLITERFEDTGRRVDRGQAIWNIDLNSILTVTFRKVTFRNKAEYNPEKNEITFTNLVTGEIQYLLPCDQGPLHLNQLPQAQ